MELWCSPIWYPLASQGLGLRRNSGRPPRALCGGLLDAFDKRCQRCVHPATLLQHSITQPDFVLKLLLCSATSVFRSFTATLFP